MFQRLAAQRLLALFMFGIPLLPAAMFGGWAVLIGLVSWTVERAEGMD